MTTSAVRKANNRSAQIVKRRHGTKDLARTDQQSSKNASARRLAWPYPSGGYFWAWCISSKKERGIKLRAICDSPPIPRSKRTSAVTTLRRTHATWLEPVISGLISTTKSVTQSAAGQSNHIFRTPSVPNEDRDLKCRLSLGHRTSAGSYRHRTTSSQYRRPLNLSRLWPSPTQLASRQRLEVLNDDRFDLVGRLETQDLGIKVQLGLGDAHDVLRLAKAVLLPLECNVREGDAS